MGEELRREPKHQGSAPTEGRLLARPEEGDSVVLVAATAAAIWCLRTTGVSKENNTLLSETWQRLSTFPLQGSRGGRALHGSHGWLPPRAACGSRPIP